MISVIIPSYNSATTIRECLDALIGQSYLHPYEIIVADSSTDQTAQIVQSNYPDVQLIRFEHKTDPGTARNAGVEKSRGDLILFIDSDCRADGKWIERMVSLQTMTDHAAIGGAVCNGNDPHATIAWAGYLAEFREFIPEHPARLMTHIPTCNISYKREVFERLQGFNPDYYPQEDLEFNYRIIDSGGTIYFSPDIIVHHHHRSHLSDFLRHQKKVGEITSRMLKILPLAGADIARSRFLSVLMFPILPVIKWLKTIWLFLKIKRSVLFKHPLSLVVFALGLIPWSVGFLKGVFDRNYTKQGVENK